MAASNSNDDSSWKNVHNQHDWEPSSDDDDDNDNHEFYDAPETTPPITTEVNREAELLHERLNSQLSTSETVEKKKTPG